MPFETTSLNALWAELIVEELVRNDADFFCLAPGSRNTPLTMAVAMNQRARSVMHYDERGVAFHALGWARASQRPAVVICTSGTATANILPAVIEASMDMVPLIVLTADRPPELRHTGANQTIDQVKIYGDYVRWFCDLPCPTDEIDPEVLLTTVDQAVYRAVRSPSGPVHINCMFREPLAPAADREDFTSYLFSIEKWWKDSRPYTAYVDFRATVKDEPVEAVAEILRSDDGIITVGRLQNSAERKAVQDLVTHLNWPVFPDIASGLRLGVTSENVIPYFDQLMLSESFTGSCQPLQALQIGGVPTSKRLQEFVRKTRLSHYVMITDHPFCQDPDHRVTLRLETDITFFCRRIIAYLDKKNARGAWLDGFMVRSRLIDQVLKEVIDDSTTLSEPGVARLVSQNIADGSGLFLASSMPIRDMDVYADPKGPNVTVGCNRGASGIDGTIASAAGFAQGLNEPVTLLIGDLAFLHDVNSLALIKSLKQPLIIVVINNNGGGMFSFLPIAKVKKVFEPYFGTPHDLNFENTAKMFGIEYHCPGSKEEFITSYRSLQKENRSAIIEVRSDREENYRIHQEIEEKVKAALENIK